MWSQAACLKNQTTILPGAACAIQPLITENFASYKISPIARESGLAITNPHHSLWWAESTIIVRTPALFSRLPLFPKRTQRVSPALVCLFFALAQAGSGVLNLRNAVQHTRKGGPCPFFLLCGGHVNGSQTCLNLNAFGSSIVIVGGYTGLLPGAVPGPGAHDELPAHRHHAAQQPHELHQPGAKKCALEH